MQHNSFGLGDDEVRCTSTGDLCGFKNGKLFPWTAKWLHHILASRASGIADTENTTERKHFKAGIFDNPQIGQLIKDSASINSTNEAERKAWTSFVAVVESSLGKCKADSYVELINEMLNSFKSLICNMSIKMHSLHNNLDRFSESFRRHE